LREVLVAVAVFLPMMLEAAIARRNERRQRARGAVEPAGDVFPIMQVAYPASFLAMLLEGWSRGGPSPGVTASGALLFVTAKALKAWVVRTLGERWTFRVLVVPGVGLISAGPYRYLRHPNYVAVAAEFVAVALMTGSLVTGPLTTVLFGVIMLRRTQIEDRALARERHRIEPT
jgi:methyltransferase